MEIILILLLTYFDTSSANDCKNDGFKVLHKFDQMDLSPDIISSNTGIRGRAMCALECLIKDGCLSFSFTDGEHTCNTYSRLIGEKRSAVVFNTTKFFSKIFSPGLNSFTSTTGKRFQVFLDLDTENRLWFVIQRRTNKDVGFRRKWTQYKNGFGDLLGNFWIGNDNLHLLASTPRILRIELEAWDGTKGYAQYSTFQVANEDQNYRLSVKGFSGSVSRDAFGFHDGSGFSTYDKDVSQLNCATAYQCGWWFKNCYDANLNGLYKTAARTGDNNAMLWKYFPSSHIVCTPLKKTKMMIR